MRETDLASKVIYELRHTHNSFVINIAGSQYQQPGLPDCLIIKDGIFIFVEFKGEKTIIEPHQSRIMQQLEKQKVHAYIVRFLHQKEWLIDGTYSIKFNKFKDGVNLLLQTLLQLEDSRKGELTDISLPITST